MQLIKEGKKYVALSSYEERAIPKGACFRWNPKEKIWWTDSKQNAATLYEYASPELREELEAFGKKRAESKELSRASTSTLSIPVPEGLEYMPFQKAGIEYAVNRESVLIGDEMGLGKTIQAIGVINLDVSVQSVLVICPASLKINWQREMEKWLVRPMTIGIADSKTGMPETDVVIVNYDILKKLHDKLREKVWDVLIADECHYLKNGKAQRTKEVVGSSNKKRGNVVKPITAKRRMLLTGTPILNRPVELWPIVNYLDPQEWSSFWSFTKRYCNAFQDRWGWDMTGASNLDELQEKLRATIMVRRLKKDVLKELPAKVRQIIDLPTNGSAAIIDAENQAWKRYENTIADLEKAKAKANSEEYAEAVEKLREAYQVAFGEMSKVRHETAVAKIPHVIKYLDNALETQSKIVFFAHHQDVIEAIKAEYGDDAVVVYGPTKMEDRQVAIDAFQNDLKIKLFIGSIKAAGVGLTLTAASHVIFAELDWTPGNITQAEDRCHRISQHDSVLVQHLVFAGSLDSHMARTLVSKQKVADAALDTKTEKSEMVRTAPVVDKSVSEPQSKLVIIFTNEQIEAIHTGLQNLAAMCDGAQSVDSAGFNKLDTDFGKTLAASPFLSQKQAKYGLKMVNKYRRQLPADLVVTAKGE